MNIVKGIGQFWYDFVIGDDWKVAAAVVTVLSLGALLAAAEIGVDGSLLVPLLAGGIAVAFTLSLLVDVLSHRR
jgi:hypothetical protein